MVGYVHARPVEIRLTGAVLISDIIYQLFGAAGARIWGNGQPYLRSFDTDGRPAPSPAGSDTCSLSFDAAGRLAQAVRSGQASADKHSARGAPIIKHRRAAGRSSSPGPPRPRANVPGTRGSRRGASAARRSRACGNGRVGCSRPGGRGGSPPGRRGRRSRCPPRVGYLADLGDERHAASQGRGEQGVERCPPIRGPLGMAAPAAFPYACARS